MKLKSYLNQNFSDLKQRCLKTNTLFEDDDTFAATQSSLYKKNANTRPNEPEPSSILWLRPHQFVENPLLVSGDKLNSTLICQGQLGNWSVYN